MSDDKNLKDLSQDEFSTEKVNVISNNLLGDYVDGVYVISTEIREELVTLRKVKKSVYKNSVFCSAFIVDYGDVVFELTFQKNSTKNLAKAELFVLENEYKINGYIQNTIRTKVSEYVDGIENFIEKTYDYFHIEITDGGRDYKPDEDDFKANYINSKRLFNLNMAKLTSKEYNKLYKNYVTARLEALKKKDNEFSRAVLGKFNSEFSKIEKYFLKENNYKALSELLDKSIEDCLGVNPKLKAQEKEVMDSLTPIVDDFSKQAEDVYNRAHERAIDNLPKDDKVRLEDMEREAQRQAEEAARLREQAERQQQGRGNTSNRTTDNTQNREAPSSSPIPRPDIPRVTKTGEPLSPSNEQYVRKEGKGPGSAYFGGLPGAMGTEFNNDLAKMVGGSNPGSNRRGLEDRQREKRYFEEMARSKDGTLRGALPKNVGKEYSSVQGPNVDEKKGNYEKFWKENDLGVTGENIPAQDRELLVTTEKRDSLEEFISTFENIR